MRATRPRGTYRRPTGPQARTAPTNNLLYRWRATTITGLADGAAVATWPSMAGGVDLTQATAGSQPTYVASAVNSRPALRWVNGANTQYMLGTGLTSRSQPYTIAAVVKSADVATAMHVLHWTPELQINNSQWYLYAGANLIGTTGPTSNQWLVVTATVNGSTSTIHMNGTQVAAGNAGGQAAGTTLNLGRNSNASRYWRGDQAEILMYAGALDATTRATLHSYVQEYYGITVSDFV